jgi:hypothetical protein
LQFRGLLRARSRFPEIVENNENAEQRKESLEGANALAKQEYCMELLELLERLSLLGRVRAPASEAGALSAADLMQQKGDSNRRLDAKQCRRSSEITHPLWNWKIWRMAGLCGQ